MCDQSRWFPHARDGIIGLALVAEPSPLFSLSPHGPVVRRRFVCHLRLVVCDDVSLAYEVFTCSGPVLAEMESVGLGG